MVSSDKEQRVGCDLKGSQICGNLSECSDDCVQDVIEERDGLSEEQQRIMDRGW